MLIALWLACAAPAPVPPLAVAPQGDAGFIRVFPRFARASERRTASHKHDGEYAAMQVLDDDPKTAWVAELDGEDTLSLHLDEIEGRTLRVEIWAGTQESSEAFAASTVPTDVEIVPFTLAKRWAIKRRDVPTASVKLARASGPQRFELDLDGHSNPDDDDKRPGVPFEELHIRVKSTDAGTGRLGASISDVRLWVERLPSGKRFTAKEARTSQARWNQQRRAKARKLEKQRWRRGFASTAFVRTAHQVAVSQATSVEDAARELSPEAAAMLTELERFSERRPPEGAAWKRLVGDSNPGAVPEGFPVPTYLASVIDLRGARLVDAEDAGPLDAYENPTVAREDGNPLPDKGATSNVLVLARDARGTPTRVWVRHREMSRAWRSDNVEESAALIELREGVVIAMARKSSESLPEVLRFQRDAKGSIDGVAREALEHHWDPEARKLLKRRVHTEWAPVR